MFSFRSFIVSGLMLKSLIHFKLIFLSGIRWRSSFIILHVDIQFSQQHFSERFLLLLLPVYFWHFYRRLVDSMCSFLLFFVVLISLFFCRKVTVVKRVYIYVCVYIYMSMGILWARILKWVAIPFSRGSSQPKDRKVISEAHQSVYQYYLLV